MAHGEFPQNSDFIANHMFSPSHQPFADDLGGIVLSGTNMDSLYE